MRRRHDTGLLPVLVLVAVQAGGSSSGRAEEPSLRLARGMGDALVVQVLPHAALPEPEAWNLYRGQLPDVALYDQIGDPDGRCSVAGTETTIVLSGELAEPGDHYYLLTGVAAAVETGLGRDSDEEERPNDAPCELPCGTDVIDVASVRGTEGIAIASDGTLYYSQPGFVGRLLPGGIPEPSWVALPGAGTVWGVVIRDDGMLFAGSPTGAGTVFAVDTTAMTPTADVLFPGAGSANGLTIGPDDALYYGDFGGGRVYRVSDAGERTEVTASPVNRANGIFFDDDGTLLVLAYSDAEVWRLTVDAGPVETGRNLVHSVPGAALDGIARDELGRYYLSDNRNGRLLRYDATFANEEVILVGVGAAANIAFGKGALGCHDVYVASSGDLGRFAGDARGRP